MMINIGRILVDNSILIANVSLTKIWIEVASNYDVTKINIFTFTYYKYDY